jgi:predicted DNA-binding transcriptional regulator AlpA
MAYQRVPRPANAVPDEMVWKALGLSRATFFRKLKDGAISAPVPREGTARRWWTPADIELAHQELTIHLEKGRRTA